MKQRAQIFSLYSAFLLFLILTSAIMLIVSIGDPISDRIERTHPVYTQTSYLVDEQDNLSWQQVISHPELTSAPLALVPWELGEQSYWLKITFHNRAKERISLVSHFDNPMVDKLSIWLLKDGNRIDSQLLGDTIKGLSKTDYAFPHYAFSIEEKEKITLLVKIRTNGIAKTPINTYQVENFQKLQQSSYLIWGIFIGVAVMISLYNIVLYTTIKDPVYLAYISYIAATLILLGCVLGFGYYLWPLWLQSLFQHYVVFFNFCIAISALLFASRFLRYHLLVSRLNKVIKFALVCLATCAAVSLLLIEYHAAPLFFINMALLYIVFIIIIFNRLLTDFKWAKFYFISWLPLIIGALVQPLTLLGVIEYTFITRHAFLIGVLLEVVLMALALADKFSFEQQKNYFRATHNNSSNLPNHTLFEYRVQQLLEEQRRFSVCLIEVKNFAQFLPYLQKNEKQHLLDTIRLSLQPILNHESGLFDIEVRVNNQIKLSHLRDGVFGILLSHRINQDMLTKLLYKIQASIPSSIDVNGLLIDLSTHLAVCDSTLSDDKSDIMMRRAWQALNKAHQENLAISFYQRSDSQSVAQKLALATELQQALSKEALSLHYTPIFTTNGKSLHGLRCSIYWKHTKYGVIPERNIIQTAKETGLSFALNSWLLKTVHQTRQSVLTLNSELQWYITLDLHHLPSSGYIQEFSDIFSETPNTERYFTLLTNFDTNLINKANYKELLSYLHSTGFNLGCDNFSGDFTSLLKFVDNQYSILQLNPLFIQEHPNISQFTLFLTSLTAMARRFNMEVITTGVDQHHLLDVISDCGSQYVQGEVLGERMNISQLLFYLKQQSLTKTANNSTAD